MKHLFVFCLSLNSLFTFAQNQPVLERRTAEIIQQGKFQFKDLNKNKKLDRYEDWRLPVQERVKDLV
jgi:beta-glucosidase